MSPIFLKQTFSFPLREKYIIKCQIHNILVINTFILYVVQRLTTINFTYIVKTNFLFFFTGVISNKVSNSQCSCYQYIYLIVVQRLTTINVTYIVKTNFLFSFTGEIHNKVSNSQYSCYQYFYLICSAEVNHYKFHLYC